MKHRIMKNGIFCFSEKWIELNIEDAKECTAVAVCTDGKKVAVYYSTIETRYMTDEQIGIVRDLAIDNGMDEKRLEYYGIIDPVDTYIRNVDDAQIIHF